MAICKSMNARCRLCEVELISIVLGCIIMILATILQSAAQNIGMFIGEFRSKLRHSPHSSFPASFHPKNHHASPSSPTFTHLSRIHAPLSSCADNQVPDSSSASVSPSPVSPLQSSSLSSLSQPTEPPLPPSTTPPGTSAPSSPPGQPTVPSGSTLLGVGVSLLSSRVLLPSFRSSSFGSVSPSLPDGSSTTERTLRL